MKKRKTSEPKPINTTETVTYAGRSRDVRKTVIDDWFESDNSSGIFTLASFNAEILTHADRMRGRQDKQIDPTEVGKTETIRGLSKIFGVYDDRVNEGLFIFFFAMPYYLLFYFFKSLVDTAVNGARRWNVKPISKNVKSMNKAGVQQVMNDNLVVFDRRTIQKEDILKKNKDNEILKLKEDIRKLSIDYENLELNYKNLEVAYKKLEVRYQTLKTGAEETEQTQNEETVVQPYNRVKAISPSHKYTI